MLKPFPTVLTVKLKLALFANKASEHSDAASSKSKQAASSSFAYTKPFAILPKWNDIQAFTFWAFYF